MQYYNRDGGKGINWNQQDLFRSSSKVRGVDNVIDVMLVNHFGNMLSVEPSKFVSQLNQGDWPSVMDQWRTFRCNDDHNEPIECRTNDRSNIEKNFNILWKNGGGGYADASDNKQVKFDKVQSWRDGLGWLAMKISDPGINDSKEKNCTEFSILYHRLDCMTELFIKGYRLFDMTNLNNYKNWVQYKPSGSGNHYSYFLAMYLSSENYAKELGCFNAGRDDMRVIASRLFSRDQQGLTNHGAMTNMANEFCTSAIPSYSYLTTGTYRMGTTIYSPNTKYKCIMQPDGNLVTYELQGSNQNSPSNLRAVWSSDTYLKAVMPLLAVQADGNIVIYPQTSPSTRQLSATGAIWSTNTRGSDCKLGLSNNGDLFVFTSGSGRDFTIHYVSGSKSRDTLKNEILSDVTSFYDKCMTDGNWGVNKGDLLRSKTQFCMQGNNIYSKSECKDLYRGFTVDGDSGDTFKKQMDNHVLNNICKDGYDKNNSALVNFCSCAAPYGDALAIFKDANYHPMCWEEKCMKQGYKLNSLKEYKCPSSVCIQNISLQNVVVKAGATVSQSCKIDNNPTATNATPPATGNSNAPVSGNQTKSTPGTTPTASPPAASPPAATTPAAIAPTTTTPTTAASGTTPARTSTEEIIYIMKNPSYNMPMFVGIVGLILFILIALLMPGGGGGPRQKRGRRKRKTEEEDEDQKNENEDE